MQIRQCDLHSCHEEQKYGRRTLISSVSFEARSIAASKVLNESGIVPHKNYVFDYATAANPIDEDLRIRNDQRKHFSTCFGPDCQTVILEKFPATSFSHIVRQMVSIFSSSTNDMIYIDISCMTRVHLLAIVSSLFRTKMNFSGIYFLYSSPISYAFETGHHLGWRDVIHVPIGRPKPLTREGHAIGLVLPGHDTERLTVALDELEPGGGIVVFSNNPQRPDFLCRSSEVNQHVVRRLKSLSLDLGMVPDASLHVGWEVRIADLFDAPMLSDCVERVVDKAKTLEAPLILYPFGPKVHTLIAALKMAHAQDVDCWAVYPIPTRFEISATEGIGQTACFSIMKRHQSQHKDGLHR